MSDYVFEFGVSTNKIGSDTTDVVDLVDDWGWDESELEGKSDEEIIALLDDEQENFVWNNIDSWVTRA